MEEASHPIFQDLPPEVITNCLQFLDPDDLLDCRLVSHQFNNLILSSQEIMRKLKFIIQYSTNPARERKQHHFLEQKFIDENEEDLVNLMELNGHRIRKIEFKSILINYLMKSLPNLEELTIDECLTYFRGQSEVDKWLTVSPQLECFMIFNNLKELKVEISMEPNFEVLTDFVAQQPNLKRLSIKFVKRFIEADFPTSDITSKVTFQLENFEFHTSRTRNYSQHFHKFIESQAKFLDTLSIDFNPDEQLGEIIVKNCRNLKTLSLLAESGDDLEIFQGCDQIWTLPSVTTLVSKNMKNPKFDSIIARLPNISILKCESLCLGSGSYNKITEIEVDSFYANQMRNCSFFSLKSLEIKKLFGEEYDDWMYFMINLINIEKIIISYSNYDSDIKEILHFGFGFMKDTGKLKYWNFMNKEKSN